MPPRPLRFRQVHLDFHTSPSIPEIGSRFDKKQWQETLRKGHVNSITLFSKCHHGWSYHPTSVGKQHPHLHFDLLRAQYEATKEIGVNAPIYLSAGLDNLASDQHPEWREVGPDGTYVGWAKSPLEAGFHQMDFHSPYLDYLCGQITEVVRLFPECDGIFLDIISQGQSCTKWSLQAMEEHGLDPSSEQDRIRCSLLAIEKYYEHTTAACRTGNPNMPVFHNGGHVSPLKRKYYPKFFSHLELESLPTGGWGYDHFPASAKYAIESGFDFLGMTGKFHTNWGEFGGYKHPNALRYECAAMLAFGSKCSVGDQLHPSGKLDESTYELIGSAYREVEAKEPWCDHVRNIADIGLLTVEAVSATDVREHLADTGAHRILLEGHFLYSVVVPEADFSRYRMLVLPDEVPVNEELKKKLEAYLAQGGRLFLSGASGLDGNGFCFDIGAEDHGLSDFKPDFVLPAPELRPAFVDSPFVMHLPSRRLRVTTGQSLGDIHDPYFNRSYEHFCSHQHSPARPEPSGFDCGVRNGNILYLAHPVFTLYRASGAVALRHYVGAALRSLLGSDRTLETDMPSSSRVSLMHQPSENRHILHLLYANTLSRGGDLDLAPGTVGSNTKPIQIIEELQPLTDVHIALSLSPAVRKITLEPEGREIPFEVRDGTIRLRIDRFTCHQMVVLQH